jgi:hypothetical protein
LLRHPFFTVTDNLFFPGTLATVNSVLAVHPASDVVVVNNQQRGLNAAQAECFNRDPHVQLVDSGDLLGYGRHCGAWEGVRSPMDGRSL